MSRSITESDWRHFKQVRAALLERFCQQTLEEVQRLAQARDGTAHERYLRTYRLLERRDRDLARAFNDFRRSTAFIQLVIMRSMGLLTDQDLTVFSEVLQQQLRDTDSLWKETPKGAPSRGRGPRPDRSEEGEGPSLAV